MDIESLYDLREMDSNGLEYLHPEHEIHNKPVKSFSDPRISGLQCFVDTILSNNGTIRDHNTIDVTEFFRLEEPFSVGYGLAGEVITPVMRNYVGFFKIKDVLKDLIQEYSEVIASGLKDKIYQRFLDLTCIRSDRSLHLNKKTFEMDSKFLENRFIVTGSNTGIGRETAIEIARRGGKVVLHYPAEEHARGALSAVDYINEHVDNDISAAAFMGDFRDGKKAIDKFMHKALEFLEGELEVLINNAGITLNKRFEEMTENDFNSLYNINNKGLVFSTMYAIPSLEKSEGVVINLSSPHAHLAKSGHIGYAMTKSAVLAATRGMAIELGPRKIRVNAVTPGWCATLNHYKLMPNVNFHEAGKGIPAGRVSRPFDVAKAIASICSDDNRYITGDEIRVDGGILSKLGDEAMNFEDVPFGHDYV